MRKSLTRPWAVLLLIVLLGGPGMAGAGQDDLATASLPPAGPASESHGPGGTQPGAWLSGPFGRVPGLQLTPDAPAPDPAALSQLDAFVRRAPLRLDVGGAEEDLSSWSITAVPLAVPAALPELLASGSQTSAVEGPLRVTGPDGPGEYLLEADVQDLQGRRARLAWRLWVPDREPPEDGQLDVPAPLIIVSTPLTVSSGRPGNGCYVYTCVEIGRTPPGSSLPLVEVQAGGTLSAHLSDGSAMSAWSVMFQPASGGEPLRYERPAGETATTLSLEAPLGGEWLVSLVVVFDRERGWFETLFRLLVE